MASSAAGHVPEVSRDSHAPEPHADALVKEHLGLAKRLAMRYAGRGEPTDDLNQVALLGLVLAAKRFDPGRRTEFTAYAAPTILGELRRHFRDRCWAVKVPRPIHDLYRDALGAWERLAAELGREPTMAELAARLGAPVEQVAEALNGGEAYSTLSLDSPAIHDGDGPRTVEEVKGDDDADMATVEQREAAHALLAQLPARERRVLAQWFYGNRTQTQIAEELGVSQMHVSRIIDSTVKRLRSAASGEGDTTISWPRPRRRPDRGHGSGRTRVMDSRRRSRSHRRSGG